MLLDATTAYYEHNIPKLVGTGNSLIIKVNYTENTAFPGYDSATIGFLGAPIPAPIHTTPVSFNPPTLAPIDPPTLVPFNAPTSVSVNTTNIVPIILPTLAPVNLLTSETVN